MIARPRLLLLDEPSLGLAPRIVQDIFRVLGEINREGTTVPARRTKRPPGPAIGPSGLRAGDRRDPGRRALPANWPRATPSPRPISALPSTVRPKAPPRRIETPSLPRGRHLLRRGNTQQAGCRQAATNGFPDLPRGRGALAAFDRSNRRSAAAWRRLLWLTRTENGGIKLRLL